MRLGFNMLLWTTHVTDAHWPIVERLQATGYADMRPLGAKLNPVDQVRNRRVELVKQ